MPASGLETTAPALPVLSTAPAPPSLPEGFVAVSQAEHNRVQAENRRLAAAAEQRVADDAAAEAARQQAAAVARGDFDTALSQRDTDLAAANARADGFAISDAIRDDIGRRGLNGEQAQALKGLVPAVGITLVDGVTDPAVVKAAVDAVVAQYPAMFKASEAPAVPTTDPVTGLPVQPAAPRVPVTPAVPVIDGSPHGVGLLTMEEYMATPQHIRVSDPEFAKRVAASRHNWPTEVPATSFSTDAS